MIINMDPKYAAGFLPTRIGNVILVILSPSKSLTSIITSLPRKIKKLINVKNVGFINSPIIAPPYINDIAVVNATIIFPIKALFL